MAASSVAVPEAVSRVGRGCRIPCVPLVVPGGDDGRLRLLVMLGLLRSHCSTCFCCSLLHSGLQQPPELFCVISRSSPSPSPSSPPPPLAQPPIPAPSSCLHPCSAPRASQGEGVGREPWSPAGSVQAGKEKAGKGREGEEGGRQREKLTLAFMMLPESCPLKENLVPSFGACSAQGRQLLTANVSRVQAAIACLPPCLPPLHPLPDTVPRGMRTAGHAAPGDGMEVREVLWGVLWSRSSTLISHKRRYRDPRAGQILADGIVALFSRVISLPPPPPCPLLPLPAALPDPVPCSAPCPQHGAARREVTVIFTA